MECGGWAPARRGKARKRILFVVLDLAVVVLSVLLYRYFASWEFTDDAEIDGYIYPVSNPPGPKHYAYDLEYVSAFSLSPSPGGNRQESPLPLVPFSSHEETV